MSDGEVPPVRHHSLTSVLAVVACATVAVGGDCLTAIEQWADNAPLGRLKITRDLQHPLVFSVILGPARLPAQPVGRRPSGRRLVQGGG